MENEKKLEMPSFELIWVPAKNIRVLNDDNGYQRSTSEKKVDKIIGEYDKNMVNPIKVYNSLGTYFAFNGQHTLAVLKKVFGCDAKVPCLLYEIDDNKAAFLFERQNGVSSNPTPADKHKSKMFRNDKVETDIAHIIEQYDFSIADSKPMSNNFRCFVDVYNAYKLLGRNDFEKMIRIIKRCWYNDKKNTAKEIVIGLSQFIAKFGEQVSEDALTDKIISTNTKPSGIIDACRMKKERDGKNRYIYAFMDVYNYKRGKKLSLR